MGNKSFGNSAYEIPVDVLRKHLPETVEYFEDLDEDLEDELLEEASEETLRHIGKIKEWGESIGLTLGVDYRDIDDDNSEDLPCWFVFCENAVTINPAFTEIGGEQTNWSSWG